MTRTLTGSGGVQGLDDDHHRRRKSMFMEILTPDSIESLVQTVRRCWRQAAEKWKNEGTISLKRAAEEVLMRGVCEWAGVRMQEKEVRSKTRQMVALFESPGDLFLGYLRGILARKRLESWGQALVQRERRRGQALPESPLARISVHRDSRGRELPSRVAAVELLNLLRPTVAVSRYVLFAALALRSYPRTKDFLQTDEGLRAFVQEVRRTTPFFPFAVALVRKDFNWGKISFQERTRTLLDLYGTNYHPAVWQKPEEFEPSRFLNHRPGPFEFIPHGGGDHLGGHRCAGEAVAVWLLEDAVRFLSEDIKFDVPPQDMSVRLNRFPAAPADGFHISRVETRF